MQEGVEVVAGTLGLLMADWSDTFRGVLGVGFALALLIFTLGWHFWRSSDLLSQWAAQNGYRIIHEEYRWLRRGPFFWTSSKGQTVYYVVVQDSAGNKRRGWVRCGSWWFGLMSDQVEARWED